MTSPVLDFWFDFASTYSYPAAIRIAPLAREAGVTVRFCPFLLGPVFKAQGWNTSPFNLYPAKGRNMWRDLFVAPFAETKPWSWACPPPLQCSVRLFARAFYHDARTTNK